MAKDVAKNSVKKVFVSHACVDKELVGKFVDDVLRLGVGLDKEQIFCASLEDMGIPTGKTFVQFIKDELVDCVFVIAMITPSYYESVFCIAELGATWVMDDKDFFPLLVPPFTYTDLKAILVGVQAAHLDDKTRLSELHDRLRKALPAGEVATGMWEAKRDQFLNAFELLTIAGPSKVPFTEHKVLEDAYQAAQTIIGQQDAEVTVLKKQIADLEACKDATQVAAVRKNYSTELEEFTRLSDEFEELADAFKTLSLPKAVVEAMYHMCCGQPWYPGRDYEHDLESPKNRGFISNDEDGVSVRSSHPPVKAALKKLEELKDFIAFHSDSDFAKHFSDSHDYELTIANIDLWSDYLGL